MGSGNYVPSFEKVLAQLRKDVLVMDDHTLMESLGEFLEIRRNSRIDGNLRLEQEADIMFDVCRKELDKRGCFVEEFGDVG